MVDIFAIKFKEAHTPKPERLRTTPGVILNRLYQMKKTGKPVITTLTIAICGRNCHRLQHAAISAGDTRFFLNTRFSLFTAQEILHLWEIPCSLGQAVRMADNACSENFLHTLKVEGIDGEFQEHDKQCEKWYSNTLNQTKTESAITRLSRISARQTL